MSAGPHPQMQAILAEMQGAPPPAYEALPIQQARQLFEQSNRVWNTELPAMAARDVMLGGVACRVLGPASPRPGVIVFVHGGGWTFGSPTTHERFARLLAALTPARLIMPDYRLAPEHPAPAAILDVLAVLGDLGGVVGADERLVLCGDSAGANVALGAALEQPARAPCMLSLLYGCFAPIFDTSSHQRNGDGRYGLSTARMRWYWENWLGAQRDPRALPLERDLAGLPRCHLVAAGLDALCDDSLLLADQLARHGVPVSLDIIPGVVHGFLQMTSRLSPARDAVRRIAAEIASGLNNDRDGEKTS